MTPQRQFAIVLCVGVLLLATSPFIWHQNHLAIIARRDPGTVAFQMRSDIFLASVACGVSLLLGGWIGCRNLRGVRGRLATREATFAALPVFGFAAALGFRTLPALYYLPRIYKGKGTLTIAAAIPADPYSWLHIVLMCAGGMSAFLLFAWRIREVNRMRSRYPPTCENCGYSLRGLKATICPECGTASLEEEKE